jgi:hypothetical protein
MTKGSNYTYRYYGYGRQGLSFLANNFEVKNQGKFNQNNKYAWIFTLLGDIGLGIGTSIVVACI